MLVDYGMGNCVHADSRKSPSLDERVYKTGPFKGLGIIVPSVRRRLRKDDRGAVVLQMRVVRSSGCSDRMVR